MTKFFQQRNAGYLRDIYNRLSRDHGDSKTEYYMQRARVALNKLSRKDFDKVDSFDLMSLEFLYNRMEHVFGENTMSPHMQNAKEGLEGVNRLVNGPRAIPLRKGW